MVRYGAYAYFNSRVIYAEMLGVTVGTRFADGQKVVRPVVVYLDEGNITHCNCVGDQLRRSTSLEDR